MTPHPAPPAPIHRYIFFLSHGDYKSPQIIARVMDYYQFM